jgi:TPP-dependent pyruvate/acetoin dehydrogenase alpha subunit
LSIGVQEQKLVTLESEVMGEVDRATAAAQASPTPSVQSAYNNVWADGGIQWRN